MNARALLTLSAAGIALLRDQLSDEEFERR